MNTTQSIILYRNPAEQMFWEGGYAFPLIASLATIVVVFLVLMKILEVTVGSWKVNTTALYSYTTLAVSLIAGVLVFIFLFI